MQIHSAAGHLQAAGQRLALTLLCGGPLIMGFFMLCLSKSLFQGGIWRLCSPAHSQHGLYQGLGFGMSMGWARAAALPTQMQTSPTITSGTTSPHWSMAQFILVNCVHCLWHRAAPGRQCACHQERKKHQHFLGFEGVKNINLLPQRHRNLAEFKSQEQLVKVYSNMSITVKPETFLPRCSPTG